MDGYFLDYANVLKLEKMPSKQELIRDVAIMIKKVPPPHLLHPLPRGRPGPLATPT